MTKLASGLPEGHGLGVITRDLIDDPHETHVVVAVVDCWKTTTNNDDGTVEPTVRIRQVEVVREKDQAAVRGMLDRAASARTGVSGLPFDAATGEALDDAEGAP